MSGCIGVFCKELNFDIPIALASRGIFLETRFAASLPEGIFYLSSGIAQFPVAAVIALTNVTGEGLNVCCQVFDKIGHGCTAMGRHSTISVTEKALWP